MSKAALHNECVLPMCVMAELEPRTDSGVSVGKRMKPNQRLRLRRAMWENDFDLLTQEYKNLEISTS